MSEVLLPRRVAAQPVSFLVDGGDCAACALGDVLGLSVPEVYERYAKNGCGREGGKLVGFAWWDLVQALERARWDGLLDRLITDIPFWDVRGAEQCFGRPAFSMSGPWFRYLRMAFDAGYYAIANVVFDASGVTGVPDHVVLLCGARQHWEERADGIRFGEDQVFVSCSSTRTPDEEWVTAHRFLRDRGGFNVLLARPAKGG